MKRTAFRLLAWINRMIFPSMGRKDLTKLSKLQKAIIAYRYWVTVHAL